MARQTAGDENAPANLRVQQSDAFLKPKWATREVNMQAFAHSADFIYVPPAQTLATIQQLSVALSTVVSIALAALLNKPLAGMRVMVSIALSSVAGVRKATFTLFPREFEFSNFVVRFLSGMSTNAQTPPYNLVMVGALFLTLPTVIVYFFSQKYIYQVNLSSGSAGIR